MKYAIFGDVHANLEALQAVLEKCQQLKVDKYICTGDVVGYNANPRECIALVKSLNPEVVLQGNHDEQASADLDLMGFNPHAAKAIHWTRENLQPEDRQWLADLPYRHTVPPKITVVHATLDNPHMWGYIFDTLTAAACFNYQFTQVCFCGHTHVPLGFEKFGDVTCERYTEVILQPGHKYLFNVGSVGQPRDGDPRSAFATYNVEDRKVELHRVEYDIETCQRKILDAGLPEREAQRLAYGR